jgi:hypothetical protein
MKQLLAGCALVLVLGVVGFLYRYVAEHPNFANSPSEESAGGRMLAAGTACQQDAKVCPDGSAVGRTGPNCSFAVCPLPNVELVVASTTIGFVLPEGYKKNVVIKDDSAYLASYVQAEQTSPDASTTDAASVIDVYAYPLSSSESQEGNQNGNGQQTPSGVMLSHTYLGQAGLQATTTSIFQTVLIGSNTFYEVLLGSLNGIVQSSFYLYEPSAVLRFDITEKGVQNWNDPNLNPNTLPQHKTLMQMLATLQVQG